MQLTRQGKRQAKQRMKSGRFPFPEFQSLIYRLMAENDALFLVSKPDYHYTTNIAGETQTLDLSALYSLLHAKKEGEKEWESKHLRQALNRKQQQP